MNNLLNWTKIRNKSKHWIPKLPNFTHMSLDEQYMRRCFELAVLGKGSEGTNPLVGAVIVHDNQIIGEGWHQKYGGPHAEVNAVNNVKASNRHLLPESTLYVNLEPCFHHGKTPPCVDLVIREKMKRVVISCMDVDTRVCGRSISKLKQLGIQVDIGILEKEGKHLIRRFTTYHEKKRPYIILKWAQSQDGFIGKENEQVWLTGKNSKTLVHKWRAEESAILVGTNTALVDNPKLTNRLYPGNPPLRIVLDRRARLSQNANLLDGTVPTLYITEQDLNINGVDVLQLTFDDLLLQNLLKHLHQRKIKSLIVEGGAELLSSFIQKDLWDEARIFTASKRIGNGIPVPNLSFNPYSTIEKIGKDTLEVIYFQRG